MSWWQWLRRGVDPAAPVSRSAPQLDLGRRGQRQRAGCIARHATRARYRVVVLWRGGACQGRRPKARPGGGRAEGRNGQFNELESRARRLVEQMAVALQASLLFRFGEQNVADVFVSSRLVKGSGTFGALQPSPHLRSVIERHRPRL